MNNRVYNVIAASVICFFSGILTCSIVLDNARKKGCGVPGCVNVHYKGECTDHNIVFIWNDDDESIPLDGELIQIEFTKGDTVYVCPAEDLMENEEDCCY